MDSLHNTHVKLLAFHFLSLTQLPSSSSDPPTFLHKSTPISLTETLGVVVSRDLKPNKFLKFLIDDGTGCVPCVLWLNHLNSHYFSRQCPQHVRLIAAVAARHAAAVRLGAVARVRGRVTAYRGGLQVTVEDVVAERDPNSEILHWLDCVRLDRKCYGVVGG